ncbi:unnamed protein product [Heterobilharzia americana]|nr:unnamed protein product [Heterobilharzia americana]
MRRDPRNMAVMAENSHSGNITPMNIEKSGDLDGKDVYLEKCIAFAEVTKTDRAVAMMYLQEYDWDLELSMDKYFLQHREYPKSGEKRGQKPQSHQPAQRRKTKESDIIDLTNSDDNTDTTSADLTTTKKQSTGSLPILTVLSWNIQGLESTSLSKRLKAIVEIIKKEEFHVVCLQEVILTCLQVLTNEIESAYHIFSASDHSSLWDYFVVILVRKHPNIKIVPDTVSVEEFPNSVMNRHLLSVDLNLSHFSPQSDSELNVRVFTTHLESCAEYSVARTAQLKSVWDKMSSFVNCETLT